MECRAPFCGVSFPCITGVRAWFALPAASQTLWGLDSLCHRFCSELLWTECIGAAMVMRGYGLVTSGSGLCSLQMMWSCWLHWPVTSITQQSVKEPGWESAPPNLRQWFLAGKRWSASLVHGGDPALSGVVGVLFMSEGKMEGEIDRRIGAVSAVMQTLRRSVVVKRELSQMVKLSIYWLIFFSSLIYGQELWLVTERTN